MDTENDPLSQPTTSKLAQELPGNLNGQKILKKTPEATEYLLDVSRLPHFYKCPVSDCRFSAFAAKVFVKHAETHQNCYVFCLYCSAILKLSSYMDHLSQFHNTSRYACSHCYYRANSTSYLKAHIDMEHRDVNRVLIVSTPPETLPPKQRKDLTLVPMEQLIQPYLCENRGK